MLFERLKARRQEKAGRFRGTSLSHDRVLLAFDGSTVRRVIPKGSSRRPPPPPRFLFRI